MERLRRTIPKMKKVTLRVNGPAVQKKKLTGQCCEAHQENKDYKL